MDWYVELLKNKKEKNEKKASKQVNMVETVMEQDKCVDGKQQEWMADIIKQEVAKFFKATRIGKERSVNFIQTSDFAGVASSSKCTIGDKDSWIVDTGASHHICTNLDFFLYELHTLDMPISVHLPNGSVTKVTQTGSICFNRLKLRHFVSPNFQSRPFISKPTYPY